MARFEDTAAVVVQGYESLLLIAGDHEVVRRGLRALLQSTPDLFVDKILQQSIEHLLLPLTQFTRGSHSGPRATSALLLHLVQKASQVNSVSLRYTYRCPLAVIYPIVNGLIYCPAMHGFTAFLGRPEMR